MKLLPLETQIPTNQSNTFYLLRQNVKNKWGAYACWLQTTGYQIAKTCDEKGPDINTFYNINCNQRHY